MSHLAASVLSTTASTIPEPVQSFSFGATDYIVFIVMLSASASIGVYFGFFSKSKNTTDEYLMGGKKMKTLPIAISLVASQLSAISIMSVPAENYTFGSNYMFLVLSMIACVPVLTFIITPIFYQNNISNCYEYLQMRFSKRTRQLVTALFVLNAVLTLPVIIFVPALAFSQVTGINIHLINAAVCSICVFYTMLGGIKAVVWTDVLQAGIMLSTVILVGVLGTIKVGGLAKVLEKASEGGRTELNFSWDPRVRLTVWNAFIGGLVMWTGHIGLNQSCVQRIVSLPSLQQAKKSLYISGAGIIIIMAFNSFNGTVMYARYHGCDPLQAGLVDKPDKLMPFFVQDVIGHLKGMPGVFISCVFSAALSTMSAILNSLAGVVYFDYIKPSVKHTEARANAVMKFIVVAMGCYCILAGLLVQQFDSIMQLILTISGINTGAVVGVFLLGMFVPRVNGKVAVTSITFSVLTMILIIITAQIKIREGQINYSPLPTRTDQCNAQVIHVDDQSVLHNTTEFSLKPQLTVGKELLLVTTAFGSNRDFSITEISFYWYKVFGAFLVWFIAIPLSYVWKSEEKRNPKLFWPFVRRFLNNCELEMEEVPLKVSQSGGDYKFENSDTLPKKQNISEQNTQ